LSSSKWPRYDSIYFSDFSPYSRIKYGKVGALGAILDQFDFTRNFVEWMRPYEVMAFEIFTHVFVAHPLLRELIVSALPSFESKIHVVGLPFSSAHVLKQVDKEWSPDNPVDVIYSSRFDKEKNPHLFLDVVDRCRDVKFVICTGHAELRGTAEDAVARALELAKRKRSNLRIYTGMTKGRYYKLLLNSKIQVNTSWQDWVSFTLLEALTFRCTPLYPNHRSFPQTLDYNNDWLYVPDDSLDLANRIVELLSRPPTPNVHNGLKAGIVNYHDGALNRIAGLL
jgi:glycosyltransferase involved in cell wall biosynthesis